MGCGSCEGLRRGGGFGEGEDVVALPKFVGRGQVRPESEEEELHRVARVSEPEHLVFVIFAVDGEGGTSVPEHEALVRVIPDHGVTSLELGRVSAVEQLQQSRSSHIHLSRLPI